LNKQRLATGVLRGETQIQVATVLVIDGDISIRTTLAKIFKNSGYSTITSSSFQDSLQHLKNQDVNLVLMDTNLPDDQGIQLLVKIRQQYPEIPVVVLASSYNPEWAEKAAESGVLEYYHKPMEPGLILFLVGDYLQKMEGEVEIPSAMDRVDFSV
jgi:two-component system response regulator HydG